MLDAITYWVAGSSSGPIREKRGRASHANDDVAPGMVSQHVRHRLPG